MKNEESSKAEDGRLDGNAFSILGAWKRAAKTAGWTGVEIKEVLDEAMSGDYDNLLATIIKNTEDGGF